jgi:hypothetical protein
LRFDGQLHFDGHWASPFNMSTVHQSGISDQTILITSLSERFIINT